LREARHLLFICYGNINRSAVAQVIAEAHLPKTVTVQSAGFHPEAGRPADPTMVAIARERGYDLSSVRSRVLDETMLNQADVVFVMEIEHLQRIKDGFPRGMNKIFLLGGGCHRQFRQIEIPDPYGRDKNSYLNSFKMILESIQKLAVSIE
jgi:protein-tyrosine-phosphatase